MTKDEAPAQMQMNQTLECPSYLHNMKLEQPACNPHPKAPHGFDRNASHSADRYVCDCEGWDAWQDGYEAGLRAGLARVTMSDNVKELGLEYD